MKIFKSIDIGSIYLTVYFNNLAIAIFNEGLSFESFSIIACRCFQDDSINDIFLREEKNKDLIDFLGEIYLP